MSIIRPAGTGRLFIDIKLCRGGFLPGLWLWRVHSGRVRLQTDGENGNQIARMESLGIVWRDNAAQDKAVRADLQGVRL